MTKKLLRTIFAAAAIAGIVGPAAATTMTGFTSAWFFGDSLSDPGNLFAATGGSAPSDPPYFEGRFSNGPVWAEPVAESFGAKGLRSGNFAFGGATATSNGDAVPDLTEQLGLFQQASAGGLGARPVATIWAGANDVFAGIPTGNARKAGRAAATSVARTAVALGRLGVDDVVLFNLPDLSKVPAYALFQPALAAEAAAGSQAFNRKLDRLVPRIERAGVSVVEIDIKSVFDDLISDPRSFGVADATIPCVFPAAAGGSVCSPEEALMLAFFDPVHPNSVIHQQVSSIAGAHITPVPLPAAVWLMLAALGGLAVVSRRGSASAKG